MINLIKNNVYHKDCIDGMKSLDNKCIDLTITSPPYDNLRTYDNKADFNFDKFKIIAKELYRVTKDGGVIVWVVGDATINGSETGSSFEQALYFKKIGFNLHDTMIYEKSSFSFPSINRYHQVFEYMFILSKGKPKTMNPIKDVKVKYAGHFVRGKNTRRQKDGSLKERDKGKPYADYKMRSNIWRYSTGKNNTTADDIAYNHPAIFPEKLVEDHIKSWTNEGDMVFDPMCGSGTTLKMCKKLNRNYLGFDINKEYVENIAKPRLEEYSSKLKKLKSQSHN